MSTRESLLEEINKQPEPLLKELQHYLVFLVEQRGKNGGGAGATEAGWPEGYFEATAGAFANEPLERPPQLPFERREAW